MKDLTSICLPRLGDVACRAWLRRAGCADPHDGGAFWMPSTEPGIPMLVVATVSHGWDHVSVNGPGRCATWAEMDLVKRLFFRDDEAAMQLHVPPRDHVNLAPYCLHLWRPHDCAVPRPPAALVA